MRLFRYSLLKIVPVEVTYKSLNTLNIPYVINIKHLY